MSSRRTWPRFSLLRSGWLWVSVVCVLAGRGPVWAQSTAGGLGGLIVADRSRTRVIREAEELIADGKYVDALTYLQRLLEEEQDVLLQPTGEKTSVFRSMKAEIQRIIEHLPPEGREVYLRNYGPLADVLMKEALKEQNADKLAQVARLYFHTPAGYEATYRMGLYQFDHGEPMAAALVFRRLQRTPEAAKRFEPVLSLRMALSWIRAGMPEEANALLDDLRTSGQAGSIMIAGRRRDLFSETGEPSPWLAKLIRDETGPQFAGKSDWLMGGGGPDRNAILPVPKPGRSEPWQVSTIAYSEEADDLIDPLVDESLRDVIAGQHEVRTDQTHHVLPSRQPLVAGQLVIARQLETVRMYDLESGDFLMQTFGWDKTLKELIAPDDGTQIPNWKVFLAHLMNQRLWEDGTFGRLSSDGQRLYCIQEMGFWYPISTGKEGGVIPVPNTSILYAVDLTSGKLVWDVGGSTSDVVQRKLAGRFFLGPPLPLAGRLYCLVDANSEIQLNVLNPETGELDWAQPLATPLHQNIAQDKARRTSGVSVAYSDGILICPTDAGATVALDLTTRSLLWGFPTETDRSQRRREAGNPFAARNRPANQPSMPNGWIDSTPIVHQDKVVLTPRKSDKIYLLDVLTGTRIWEQPRGNGLYVAGITNEMVVVVGLRHVQTWTTSRDQTGWTVRLSADPTGRGVIVGSKLLLPAGERILIVDLKNGSELNPIPVPKGVELGNLVVAQGRLISQGTTTLDVLPFPDLSEAKPE